jgi:predicted metal-dependent hydrolase
MYGNCSKISGFQKAIQNPRSSRNIFMSELAVRKLGIDRTTPFEKRYCGGDAFKSAFFNVVSISGPVGGLFFIVGQQA